MAISEINFNSRTSEIFAEELSFFLNWKEKLVFYTLLQYFPDPASYATLLRKLEEKKQVKPNSISFDYLWEVINGTKKTLHQNHSPFSISNVRSYGYELSHPAIEQTWWSYISQTERLILKYILENDNQLTQRELYSKLYGELGVNPQKMKSRFFL